MAIASSPECRVLFEMFSTPRGKVSLGRVELGANAGRIVMLRETPESASAELPRAVEVTKSFAHPQLLKLVGVLADGMRDQVASEYLPGVSLFELTVRARARQRTFALGAAVRLTIDALKLVQRVESLLREAGRPRVRLLFPDCVWIADYGEILLSEAGVAAYLATGRAHQEVEEGTEAVERDIMTATAELFHLATAQLMTGELAQAVKQHLPPELADVLRCYFLTEGAPQEERVANLIQDLSNLPRSLVGTELELAAELRRFAPELLAERQSKLTELGGRESSDIDSPTKVYGAAIPDAGDADEVTREVRKAFRGLPVASRMPRELQFPAQSARSPSSPGFSAPTPQRPAMRSPGALQQPEPRAPLGLRLRRARILGQPLVWWLALFVVTGVTAIAWRNPALLRDLVDRLGIVR